MIDSGPHAQRGEESLHLGGPHVPRVALAMMEDKALDPIHILRFGADAVMLHSDAVANLVEQFRRSGSRRCIFIDHNLGPCDASRERTRG